MKTTMRRRPEKSEYAEYYHQYVERVPDGDIVDVLRKQMAETVEFLGGIPPERGDFAYAPRKWTLKEVLGHVVDIEWVFTSRALCFARGVDSPLPGVDQEIMVPRGNFGARSLRSLVEEFRNLRTANTILFENLDEEALGRSGVASGCTFTVRSIPYMLAGHERHHVDVIRDRYL